jgi:hypothetical protein
MKKGKQPGPCNDKRPKGDGDPESDHVNVTFPEFGLPAQ